MGRSQKAPSTSVCVSPFRRCEPWITTTSARVTEGQWSSLKREATFPTLAFDWDRYTFDSKNYGDPPGNRARYTDQVLSQARLMALLQWDVLERRLITPFVVTGLGYGWQNADLTSWQCRPDLPHGLALGAGAGLDFAVHELVGVGVEYRINTLPLGSRICTMAEIDAEPMGPPQDALWQRIAITFSVRN
jgi:opacity protein-like surface antigen